MDTWEILKQGGEMNELALFAGAGGGILGGKLLGWKTVCAVEVNTYCSSILIKRQNEGHLSPFPIWDDVRTFDGKPWRGIVDVISGGFPCQDISSANTKREGLSGRKSGLWSEMARIISEVRPRFVFVENSPNLIVLGLDRVLADLSQMGYDARWGVVGVHHITDYHKRDRAWIVGKISNPGRKPGGYVKKVHGEREGEAPSGAWWSREPEVGRVVHGLPGRMVQLKALGNAQVPAVARLAWQSLTS